jgi:hypothetical protein
LKVTTVEVVWFGGYTRTALAEPAGQAATEGSFTTSVAWEGWPGWRVTAIGVADERTVGSPTWDPEESTNDTPGKPERVHGVEPEFMNNST